ncbi:hypothetical protein [Wielerella bovis]|uniref:hypothetical protein n=1 Tax=Wielerella bovis TaxID=2917790 RepID=UPI0020198C1C|nr:hypothetical protein [Wielerella bovis]MCG7657444.1 hypothetical protein [Wielerella bovis]MCG7659665.1 hypothetical protein [Wielerella bovis]
MAIQVKPYRKFFYLFGLLMPAETALMASFITLLLYVDFSAVGMILGVAFIFWLIGLPAAFLIVWLASCFKWTRNLKGIALTALTGFVVTLIYEFMVMWITDLITNQVGSFFHIEVLYLA